MLSTSSSQCPLKHLLTANRLPTLRLPPVTPLPAGLHHWPRHESLPLRSRCQQLLPLFPRFLALTLTFTPLTCRLPAPLVRCRPSLLRGFCQKPFPSPPCLATARSIGPFTCRLPAPLATSWIISLARPLSTTNRTPSIVMEVSAMLVEMMSFRTPSGAAGGTQGGG